MRENRQISHSEEVWAVLAHSPRWRVASHSARVEGAEWLPSKGSRRVTWQGTVMKTSPARWSRSTSTVMSCSAVSTIDMMWSSYPQPHSAAAAAAKSLQSCPTLCDPRDGSPSGSTVPGILQARTLEWVAISFSNAWKQKLKVKLLSRVRLCASPWTAAYQAPLSMEFSRQEYWSGLPFPSPMHESEKWKWSPSVVSHSSRPHGLQPTRLLCPWDFPGKSTEVGCHWLLHGASKSQTWLRDSTTSKTLKVQIVVIWYNFAIYCERNSTI